MDKIEEVKKILEKWFKDPIDEPCPYCEASKEICQLFEPKPDELELKPSKDVPGWDRDRAGKITR